MGVGLREWVTFDFCEGADFTEPNVPITNCNSSEDLLVNKLNGGSQGYMSKASVQVH